MFLNPAYDARREKYYGPHAVAALRGRPGLENALGVTCLMGQPDPKRYSLRHQLDECMKKFFAYARVQTVSLARISDSIALYDSFHFRENSASRKKLAEHLGHQLRVLIAEFTASQIFLDRLEEIHRRHAYSDKGKTFIPVIYQSAHQWRRRGGLESEQGEGKACGARPMRPELRRRKPPCLR